MKPLVPVMTTLLAPLAQWITNRGIVWVKHQVTGLGVRPRNIGTIGVLHGGAAAMADDVTAARGVVKGPIHE